MDHHIAIVGAGPYGLSIAAHLRALGRPFELLGVPLESWRQSMPRGMLLKSERFASSLWDPQRRYTLHAWCEAQRLHYRPIGDPLSLERFLEYAEWFRRNNALEPSGAKVTLLRRIPGGFGVSLADGTVFTTRQVVLATGPMAFRYLPLELADLPEPQVLHSTRIGDVRRYSGRDVTVIGGGQSALETAALLHENGARVRLLVRADRIEWNAQSKPRPLYRRILVPDAGVASGWKSLAVSELPRMFRWCFSPEKRHWFVARSYGPSGSWWLRERIVGRVEVLLHRRVASAEITRNGLRLGLETPAGPGVLETQHLVCGTGFKVNLDRLEYLDPPLAGSIACEAPGIPALDAHFETSIPGLFVVGAASAPTFGPIMRFMYGAKHVAPLLARTLRGAGA